MLFLEGSVPVRRQLTHRCSWLAGFAAATWLLTAGSPSVWAQAGAEKKAAAKPAANADDETKIPEPEDMELTTEDGLKLAVTYFPGTKKKESIPVVLLHGFKGSRKDFAADQGLASLLQKELGCAVVVPDLRGHGDSTSIKIGNRTEKLNPAKMQPAQFKAMVTQDLMAVKKFLWKENNAEKLNLDKLCLVGADMGASAVLDFAVYDSVGYDQGAAQYGPLKLGRFVKVMVLISPEMNFRGFNTRKAVNVPAVRGDISTMILVGKMGTGSTAKAMKEAETFYSLFQKSHPAADDQKLESQTLVFGPLNTKLQGAKLLEEPSLKVQGYICKYINGRLVKNPDAKKWVWKERKHPHE
jgi:pimeloyl-ACP methyl ester carboxylesterase